MRASSTEVLEISLAPLASQATAVTQWGKQDGETLNWLRLRAFLLAEWEHEIKTKFAYRRERNKTITFHLHEICQLRLTPALNCSKTVFLKLFQVLLSR